MKRIKILVLLITLLTLKGYAQEPSFKDRLYFGGNLGLSFGSITAIEISPIVGYRITEKYSVGTGVTYIYYKYYNFSTDIYGGRIFQRYLITENIFAHTEYEYLNVGIPKTAFETKRIDVHGVFVGGGYRSYLGERSAFTVMILYNLNQTAYSLYSNPIIRFGFNFGL